MLKFSSWTLLRTFDSIMRFCVTTRRIRTSRLTVSMTKTSQKLVSNNRFSVRNKNSALDHQTTEVIGPPATKDDITACILIKTAKLSEILGYDTKRWLVWRTNFQCHTSMPIFVTRNSSHKKCVENNVRQYNIDNNSSACAITQRIREARGFHHRTNNQSGSIEW